MSTGFIVEAMLDLSGNYLLSAKDAAIVAQILAKATRVNQRYRSGASYGYYFELTEQISIQVMHYPLTKQAEILMELQDPPKE
jgi:hypothetical protein